MRFDRWDDVETFALTLPGAHAATSSGQPAVNVDERMFVSTEREAGSLHVRSLPDEKDVLLATDPDLFWQTPPYANWPGLLVRYGGAGADRVALTIRRAWWDAMRPAARRGHGDRP